MVIVLKSRAIIISALVMALLCSFCLGTGVSAETKKVKLTVECMENETALEGMPWDLYRVAYKNGDSMVLTEQFRDYPVNLADLTTSAAMAASETLVTYVEADNLMPVASDIVGSSGTVVFPGLTYGLYLIVGMETEINGTFYNPTPYIITIDEGTGEDPTFNYNVYSKPKIKALPKKDTVYKFSATVKLFWEKDNSETRPKSASVTLLRDGEPYKTETLSDANNWTVTWAGLTSKYKWSVVEDNVPEGYTVTYVQNDINIDPDDPEQHDLEFIITNTGNYVPAETTKPAPKPLPQTGQLRWPIPVLSAAGMVLFAVGWIMYRRKRKRYEK